MYAHLQEHTFENLHVWTKLAFALFCKLSCNPILERSLEAVKSQTLSLKYKRARYRNKFELGSEPGKLMLDGGDRL